MMNAISDTAYYCCGNRMVDAQRDFSVVGDIYAKRFMDEQGHALFEPFISLTLPNITNIVRCRILDDWVRTELTRSPNTLVITLGAGFDSRPYRMKGGRWVEIDESAIIDFKNHKLPVEECGNPLERLSIDFTRESLVEKLKPFEQKHLVIAVIEGVCMYLSEDELQSTLENFIRLFPNHSLFCDLMNRAFFDRFGRKPHERLAKIGGIFTPRPVKPEQKFLELGYREMESVSIFRRARDIGALKAIARIPNGLSWIMGFHPALRGYATHHFQYGWNPRG